MINLIYLKNNYNQFNYCQFIVLILYINANVVVLINIVYWGALIVKDRMIISDGYNGTPTGFENFCEDEEGYTKWYVLHAEANAILKVAASTQSCKGSTLYITLSPCQSCSKLIHQAGITRVVYSQAYKDLSGVEFLEKAGIKVELQTL